MQHKSAETAEARLTLKSRLAELTLVWPWVDALAEQCALSEETRFAIHLCLEEAIANVILHGYQSQPNHTLTVGYSLTENSLSFTIEDQAPHFTPPEPHSAQAAPESLDEFQPGGQGIPLLRRFARSLAWEKLAQGNRLTITFALP